MPLRVIDGSYGEGGGQILRYAALYALVTGDETHILRIRANRPNPGLRPQHYTLLKIMLDMFGGRAEGLSIGSTQIRLMFRGVKAVHGTYNIGTAGSISLIIQALAPALALADSTSDLVLIGGTDVRWSPPIDYMRYAYTSLLRLAGVEARIEVLRRGFYPKGGGKVRIVVEPGEYRRINRPRRDELRRVLISSVVCRLPRHVLERQSRAAMNLLRGRLGDVELEVLDQMCGDSLDPGTSIVVLGDDGILMNGGDSLGERGKPAERVGEEAANQFLGWWASGASMDRHLGDMAIPLAVLAGSGEFSLEDFTRHMESALYVSKTFFEGLEYELVRLGRAYLLRMSR